MRQGVHGALTFLFFDDYGHLRGMFHGDLNRKASPGQHSYEYIYGEKLDFAVD